MLQKSLRLTHIQHTFTLVFKNKFMCMFEGENQNTTFISKDYNSCIKIISLVHPPEKYFTEIVD